MQQQGDLRDAMRDQLDDLEAAAKRLESDTARHTNDAQSVIIDNLNEIRHTLGTIQMPTAPVVQVAEHPADDARRA